MLPFDFNCDMGEGVGNDAAIMPFITSANIACGFHAGDDDTMQQTLLLAKNFGVKAGAHPSYPDRENFGRKEMQRSPQEVYNDVKTQIKKLQTLALEANIELHHVKPHGALYNRAAKDETLAKAIAQAIKDVDESLCLYGLSGSCLIRAGKAIGLQTKSEVFADRLYDENGFLTPRSMPGAVIQDEALVVRQVLEMVHKQTVTTIHGSKIPLIAETVCLHGDGPNAVRFAQAIHHALTILNY